MKEFSYIIIIFIFSCHSKLGKEDNNFIIIDTLMFNHYDTISSFNQDGYLSNLVFSVPEGFKVDTIYPKHNSNLFYGLYPIVKIYHGSNLYFSFVISASKFKIPIQNELRWLTGNKLNYRMFKCNENLIIVKDTAIFSKGKILVFDKDSLKIATMAEFSLNVDSMILEKESVINQVLCSAKIVEIPDSLAMKLW